MVPIYAFVHEKISVLFKLLIYFLALIFVFYTTTKTLFFILLAIPFFGMCNPRFKILILKILLFIAFFLPFFLVLFKLNSSYLLSDNEFFKSFFLRVDSTWPNFFEFYQPIFFGYGLGSVGGPAHKFLEQALSPDSLGLYLCANFGLFGMTLIYLKLHYFLTTFKI